MQKEKNYFIFSNLDEDKKQITKNLICELNAEMACKLYVLGS